MIDLRIKELLTQKGVANPHAWLMKRGISHSTAHRLVSGKAVRISREHINIICRTINCTPNDLFEWTPDKKRGPVSATHHLHSIAPRQKSRILDKIKNMSEAEILEWERRMEQAVE